MRKRLSVLLLSAALISGNRTLAQTSAPIDRAASTATAAPSTDTTLRMRGTVDKFDASTRMLSLSTPHGTLQLPLALTARIRQGWHKLGARDLEKLSGYRAAIRYSESGGRKIVESIHVFGKNDKAER